MKLDWKAVLGIAITVFLLWFVLRDVDFAEVWSQVRQGDMALLGAAVLVATFGFVIRALRWKVLLATVRPDTSLRSRFGAVSIGFMANNVLPARIGEFARAYAFSRLEPISVSAAFGTLVVERLLDGIVLLGFLLFTVSWPTFPAADALEGSRVGTAVDGMTVILVVLVVGLVVFLLRPRPFIRLAERAAAKLPGDFARPIVSSLEAFLDSLEILRRPGLLALALAWSVGFWLFHGLSFWLGMLAFGIRPEDSFIAALFTEAVVGFGVAVPSAPGFFGTFHWAADWALSDVYGVEPARSLAFAFGYHFGGWLPITAIGFWYAWKLGLSLGDVRRSEERVEEAVEAAHPVAAQLLAAEREPDGSRSSQNPAPVARAVAIRAPAKVNLTLRVLGRDPRSGYHELETLFQAVDLADEILVEVAASGMELRVEGERAGELGPERDNLVWRAAGAFAAETGLVRGLRIRLVKRIPAGAGLGGGSSDAAATLRALNRLFDHPVPPARLAALGARLGSDVPFFLGSEPLAVGRGRGERLSALPSLSEAWLIVGVPREPVATGPAYAALAAHRETTERVPPRILAEDPARLSWDDVADLAVNDFEEVLLQSRPDVAELRTRLRDAGSRLVLMSGSGSAVFGVWESREAAEVALAGALRGLEGVELHLARTLDAWPEPEADPSRQP